MILRSSSKARSGVLGSVESATQHAYQVIRPGGEAVRPQPNLSRYDVLSRIVDLIAEAQLPQEQFTSELEIAKLLGLAGRTPSLREALALLARDGIVQPFPQRGYFIPRITSVEMEEILVLRLSIFNAIVSRLVTAEPSPDLDVAEALCGGLNSRNTQSFLKDETAYWCELATQGGFIFAVQNLNTWGNQLRVFHAGVQLSQAIIDETAQHYRKVLKDIRERSGQDAIATIRENFELRRTAMNTGQ
jgi:DNA-binding GntR family transcriptional regulator